MLEKDAYPDTCMTPAKKGVVSEGLFSLLSPSEPATFEQRLPNVFQRNGRLEHIK